MREEMSAARCMRAKSRCIVSLTPGCRTFTATTLPAFCWQRPAALALSFALWICRRGSRECSTTLL